MNEQTKGLRFNDGKPKWSLVDFDSLLPMVRVLEYGVTKYAKDNWKGGMPVTEVTESLLRHVFAFLNGEYNDPESGISHIGHIQCNAMFLEYMMNHKPEFDDRVKTKEEGWMEKQLREFIEEKESHKHDPLSEPLTREDIRKTLVDMQPITLKNPVNINTTVVRDEFYEEWILKFDANLIKIRSEKFMLTREMKDFINECFSKGLSPNKAAYDMIMRFKPESLRRNQAISVGEEDQ